MKRRPKNNAVAMIPKKPKLRMDKALEQQASKWGAEKCDEMGDLLYRWAKQLKLRSVELSGIQPTESSNFRGREKLLTFDLSKDLQVTVGDLNCEQSLCVAERFEGWARELRAKAAFMELLKAPGGRLLN